MDWAIYAALIIGAVGLFAASSRVVVRGLRAWRDFKRFRRQLIRELDRVTAAGDRAAAAAERATDSSELNASLARLRVALARLAVLRAAFDEAAQPVLRLAMLYPRK